MTRKQKWLIRCSVGFSAVLVAFGFSVASQFLPASTRSQVSRAKSDMRSIATALEAYYTDHKAYPPGRPIREFPVEDIDKIDKVGGGELQTIEPGMDGLHGLTTPVAYLEFLPVSPSVYTIRESWKEVWPIRWIGPVIAGWEWRKPGAWPFAYYNDRNLGWILWTRGPDGIFDITDPAAVYDATANNLPDLKLVNLTYDPTNGGGSKGDIWRIKQ